MDYKSFYSYFVNKLTIDYMNYYGFFNPKSREQMIGGKMFPGAPFQIFISDPAYAERHNLPLKMCLTVTEVNYIIRKRQIRFNLKESIFDFPWEEDSIQKLTTYSTN